MASTHFGTAPDANDYFSLRPGVELEDLDPSEWTEPRLTTGLVQFVDSSHLDFARSLEDRGVPWQYKPRTFAIEWDDEGNFVDSFTPDFYLPALDLYIELTSTDRSTDAAKKRKLRLLSQEYPTVRIDLLPDLLSAAGAYERMRIPRKPQKLF